MPTRIYEGTAQVDYFGTQVLEVFDDGGNSESLDRGWVPSQRLDLYLEAGVGGGEDTVALALVALDPLLPAAWSHPQTMDKDDGVGSGRIGRVLGSRGVLLALLSAHACECVPYEISAHRLLDEILAW